MKTRAIINKSDVITDISTSINDYHTGTDVTFLTVGDYLYIGQRYSFNHLYFNVSVVNTETSALSVDLWDGNSWNAVAEAIDETNGFANSGYVTWTPDKENGWVADDSDEIDGLDTVKIYDLYWTRISTDVDFSASTALSWMGNLFCSDEDLFSEYSVFKRTNYLTAWESGKTTWEEQRVAASRMVADDLVSRGVITASGAIIERYQLLNATVSKTATIIFDGLGDDYIDDYEKATGKYNKRIGMDIFRVDRNSDGRLDKQEARVRHGKLTR